MQPLIAVPAIAILVLRAWSNNSLTSMGIFVAALTAIVHAIHPWSVFFALLVVFFLGGTAVTKVKHAKKATLTHSSQGGGGGESPRTHVQVLANSLVASILILLHYYFLRNQAEEGADTRYCLPWGGKMGGGGNALVAGIIGQYAAVSADTFSSELGILSRSPPRLITSPSLRVVPPGTNGGVTAVGLLAGILGALTIALTSVLLLPFCMPGGPQLQTQGFTRYRAGLDGGAAWGLKEMMIFVVAVTIWGGLGSLLDSFLGGWLQLTVIDAKTGRVVEGDGGTSVPVTAPNGPSTVEGEPSRKVLSGLGWVDNNGVNFIMALTMGLGAMVLVGVI